MIYSFFADGFEEIEAISPVDLLRRCNLEVKIIGVSKMNLTGANGITVCADISEDEIILDDNLEMVILPGGKNGTLNLGKSEAVAKTLDFCVKNNKYIAAICAAPSVLAEQGLLEGKRATCYPDFEDKLFGANVSGEFVTVDGNIITARGAGVSIEFGLTLVSILKGKEISDDLKKKIQCRI